MKQLLFFIKLFLPGLIAAIVLFSFGFLNLLPLPFYAWYSIFFIPIVMAFYFPLREWKRKYRWGILGPFYILGLSTQYIHEYNEAIPTLYFRITQLVFILIVFSFYLLRTNHIHKYYQNQQLKVSKYKRYFALVGLGSIALAAVDLLVDQPHGHGDSGDPIFLFSMSISLLTFALSGLAYYAEGILTFKFNPMKLEQKIEEIGAQDQVS